MSLVADDATGRQLRRLRRLYLSGETAVRRDSPVEATCRILLAGRPDSAWVLPLGVNLALAAAEAAPPALLVTPPEKRVAAARLAGAPPAGLGDPFGRRVPPTVLSPRQGMQLAARPELPDPGPEGLPRWIIEVLPPRDRRGTWLQLDDGEESGALVDPRGNSEDPWILTGLDRPPSHAPTGAVVWGSVPADFLLDPKRPDLPVWLSGHPGARRCLSGYLEALRQMGAAQGRP